MDHPGHHHESPTTPNPSMSNQVGDHGHMDMPGMDPMKMYFHFDLGDKVLFQSWVIDSVTLNIIMCIAFFLVAFFYEALKSYRENLLLGNLTHVCVKPPGDHNSSRSQYNTITISDANGDQERSISPNRSPNSITTACQSCGCPRMGNHTNASQQSPVCQALKGHIVQSILHVIQVAISYILMLVIMTYNVWLCLAIVLGAGAGYFCFCWRKLSLIDRTEHCN